MSAVTAAIALWIGCLLAVLAFCGCVLVCAVWLARRHRPHYRCKRCGARSPGGAMACGMPSESVACPMEWIG